MEDEQQAKRDASRVESERKREEEREKKRSAKTGDITNDDDIFKRRAQDMADKEARRARKKREQDDIWYVNLILDIITIRTFLSFKFGAICKFIKCV